VDEGLKLNAPITITFTEDELKIPTKEYRPILLSRSFSGLLPQGVSYVGSLVADFYGSGAWTL
jgi:hypothetical protein